VVTLRSQSVVSNSFFNGGMCIKLSCCHAVTKPDAVIFSRAGKKREENFMADKVNKSVVRNAQYRRGGLSIRQHHNERQNADYMNDDIVKDRAAHNVHFKQAQGSY
jgi:hypothetical protein